MYEYIDVSDASCSLRNASIYIFIIPTGVSKSMSGMNFDSAQDDSAV